MGIGTIVPVIGGAATEELAFRVQLAVDFKADNDLCVNHDFTACSYAYATSTTRSSSNGLPIT